MHLCVVCHVDISHRHSNARYCSKECKKSKPSYREWTCEMCGRDLRHRLRAKYCGDECAKSAQLEQRREWRADPVNHERERLSRNEAQNANYLDNEEFKEKKKAAQRKYYSENREACLAKDKERRKVKAQDQQWVEKERARRHTPAYHKRRNARAKERRATDPIFSQKERERGRRRYKLHPERWAKGRETHKNRYNSIPVYREIQKDYHRKWKFELAPGKYALMLSEQLRVCAICHGTNPDGRNLMVDHNHESGQVRGLLCVNCNLGIGKVGENSQRLMAAIAYLNTPAWTPNSIPRLTQGEIYTSSDAPRKKLISRAFKLKSRNRELMRRYGIDTDQYRWLWVEGGGVCWICRKPETAKLGRGHRVSALNVDHIHDATKKIRGLLCYNCNTGVGYFQHDIEILKIAAAYLVQRNGGRVQPKLLDKLAQGP